MLKKISIPALIITPLLAFIGFFLLQTGFDSLQELRQLERVAASQARGNTRGTIKL